MTYELIRKRVKMLKESEAMGASLSPRDYELIGLLAEREALIKLLKYKGDHDWTCQSTWCIDLPCDCGYDEAYQKIPEHIRKQIEGGE